jgi:hypothetical protein
VEGDVITATQILAHLWGDYIFQSDWMAENKTKQWWPAFVHALFYSLCFLPFLWIPLDSVHCWPPAVYSVKDGVASCSLAAPRFRRFSWLVIFGTHFLVDRYRLARYVVWAKNYIAPKWIAYDCDRSVPPAVTEWVRNESWWRCSKTGYPPDRPIWLAVWLLIIADNILHITLNGIALRYL